jgi:hypothetical protein
VPKELGVRLVEFHERGREHAAEVHIETNPRNEIHELRDMI